MNNLFTYLDELPKIPTELLNEVHQSILINPNISTIDWYKNYKIHSATDDLKDYLKPLFTNHSISVQVVTNSLHKHRDIGRTVAVNYLIDNGGNNVETCFYNNDGTLMYNIKIEEYRWHMLDVSILHNVINLERPRIAITINPL